MKSMIKKHKEKNQVELLKTQQQFYKQMGTISNQMKIVDAQISIKTDLETHHSNSTREREELSKMSGLDFLSVAHAKNIAILENKQFSQQAK